MTASGRNRDLRVVACDVSFQETAKRIYTAEISRDRYRTVRLGSKRAAGCRSAVTAMCPVFLWATPQPIFEGLVAIASSFHSARNPVRRVDDNRGERNRPLIWAALS